MHTALFITKQHDIKCAASVFEATNNSMFRGLMNNDTFQSLMRRAFEKHLEAAPAKREADPQKAADWQEIQNKLAELRKRQMNLTPFDEPLTNRELAMLDKDRRIAETRDDIPATLNYQNQNAMCYLAHIIDIVVRLRVLFAHKALNPQVLEQIALSAFALVHHKLHENGVKCIKSLEDSPDYKVLGISLADFWLSYMREGSFKTGDESKRQLTNACLTPARLLRITTMVTGMPSLWGISIWWNSQLLNHLYLLHRCEERLESWNSIALSTVWYLALCKHEIINPLTDDQENSGERVIAEAIGQLASAREIRRRPNAKPFRIGEVCELYPQAVTTGDLFQQSEDVKKEKDSKKNEASPKK
jgi:hypothetical protein